MAWGQSSVGRKDREDDPVVEEEGIGARGLPTVFPESLYYVVYASQRFLHCHLVQGEWKDSTSGGCNLSPVWKKNPRYLLALASHAKVK